MTTSGLYRAHIEGEDHVILEQPLSTSQILTLPTGSTIALHTTLHENSPWRTKLEQARADGNSLMVVQGRRFGTIIHTLLVDADQHKEHSYNRPGMIYLLELQETLAGRGIRGHLKGTRLPRDAATLPAWLPKNPPKNRKRR